MQAIILAAGRGSRLGQLTAVTPKPLLRVCGQPILAHTLAVLPPKITEVIFIIGHLGEQIESCFGPEYNNLKMTYIRQIEMPGTAGALWSVKDLLNPGKFLVLNGDDIYIKPELESCLEHPLAIGVTKSLPASSRYIGFDADRDGNLAGFHRIGEDALQDQTNIANGAYVLDRRIFDFEAVLLSNGEYGLPQTILEMSITHPVKMVVMDHWLQINDADGLAKADRVLKNNWKFE